MAGTKATLCCQWQQNRGGYRGVPNHSPPSAETPTARPRRPELDGWLRDYRRSFRKFGAEIGRSHEYVRRLCLPFGDPQRTLPDEHTAGLIAQATDGQVPPESFLDLMPERGAA